MSQIDKVIYLPLVSLFILFLICFYFFNFYFLLKSALVALYARNKYFKSVIDKSLIYYNMFLIYVKFCLVVRRFINVDLNNFFKKICYLPVVTILRFGSQICFIAPYLPIILDFSITVYFMTSPLEQFDAIVYGFTVCSYIFFTSILVPFIIIFVIFYFIYRFIICDLNIVSRPLQSFMELSTVAIFDLIKQQIGKDGYFLFPFIYIIFFFVLSCNLLSLLPFGIALTSHLIVILWLSLGICLSIFIYGIYLHNIQFLKIFIPECPILLLPMLIVIEYFLMLLELLV